ncbi:MAG TPA: CopD family protein [Magnetospirillaceae bacterium]|nr:CopD family protein [Magnetospirillaceae bacterium]
MPDYSLLKILHMIAVTLMVIGILLNGATIANPPPAARLAGLRRWDKFVTVPALVAVWILGVTLAIEGHWFPSGWLPTKLVFVLALSALHGMQAGALKKLERGQPAPAFLRFSPYLAIVLVVAILALVEMKPF